MKRAIIALASIALLASCGSPRKACRRAEGFIQRAVRICPEAAQLRTDTVTITVPGDSVTLVTAYPMPDRDSLRAVISQLTEALQAERELYVIEGAGSNAVVKHQVYTALEKVRKTVCWYPPMAIESETARGTMFIDSLGRPHGKCWCKPQRRTAEVTTQNVIAGDVQVQGGTPWWLWVIVAVLVCACVVLYVAMEHFRFHFNRLNR